MKTGEIYWVNLNPTIGDEIKKKRPVVVLNPGHEKKSQTFDCLSYYRLEKALGRESLLRRDITGPANRVGQKISGGLLSN